MALVTLKAKYRDPARKGPKGQNAGHVVVRAERQWCRLFI